MQARISYKQLFSLFFRIRFWEQPVPLQDGELIHRDVILILHVNYVIGSLKM